jgi:hypothetical protein
LVQGDTGPGAGTPIVPASPVVLSAVPPSGTFPPVKAGAAPKVDVNPSGPAPAEGAALQPESVGSPEDARSLVEVAMVPSPANSELVPSAPTPAFAPAPGQVGPAAVSVGAGLRPPAKSSVVARGIPAPPTAAVPVAMPIALVGDGAPMPSKGRVTPASGVAAAPGVVMPGGLTCATAVPQPNKATPALQPNKVVKAAITDKRIMSAPLVERTWAAASVSTFAKLRRFHRDCGDQPDPSCGSRLRAHINE